MELKVGADYRVTARPVHYDEPAAECERYEHSPLRGPRCEHKGGNVTLAKAIMCGLLVLAMPACLDSGSQSDIEFKDARIKFEINATDHDGGIQLFLDADTWVEFTVVDPNGEEILSTATNGAIAAQGGTELFVESAEPTFDELSVEALLERFPAGEYLIEGKGLNGERLTGSASLTHNLPDGPVLLGPLEDDGPQDPGATVLTWRPVGAANGSPIIAYQVIVAHADTGIAALPTITLDVMMPPDATSLAVPSGFLQPGTEYEWEVLAIEAGGNQTLSSATFVTG